MDAVRMVIDTNVFVGAGFKREGYSAKMLERIREGTWHLIWNDKTRRETERIVRKIPVLANEVLNDVFREEDRYEGALDEKPFEFITDREDRKFAALAVAADAPLITNDDHLLAWKNRLPVPVLTPADFMRARGLA